MSIDRQIPNAAIEELKSSHDIKHAHWQILIKSTFDKLSALIALIVFLPLLLIIAVLIKIDSKGPIFFRQRRNGLDNKEFLIWKFRTMRVMEDGGDVKQAERNDNRVTRLGDFLRKYSLDELPQLMNVLTGEMSVVGPRPHPVSLNEKFRPLVAKYDERTLMKPGLTGLAQITGHRGPTETIERMAGRIEKDVTYIKEWSLWLDIKIIALTPYYGLFSKNAF